MCDAQIIPITLKKVNSIIERLLPRFLSDKYSENGNLHIIRSIVTGIVPMTFGYRQEPGGVERLYTIAYEFGGVSLSYANITKFPHPFA